MSDRPLSEKSPHSPLRIHTFDWDETYGDTYVHESEYAALEAEIEDYKITFKQKLLDNGKLRAERERLTEQVAFLKGQLVEVSMQKVDEINRQIALDEGGDK